MSQRFRVCDLNQPLLLPPSLQDWLPEGHLARFVCDVVDGVDLSAITASYDRKDGRGALAYHPVMLVRLLLYGYCLGVASSRQIERRTYDDVAFRYLAADQHPDHDTIATFRQTHLTRLAGLFLHALQLCEKAGLVTLGHVAIDGTTVQANASKHKAMSYDRMAAKETALQAEVARLLAEATRVDAEEDARYGKGTRGDELPAELARRESRLKKIAEAKAALEQEAHDRAVAAQTEACAKQEARRAEEQARGKKFGGRPPQDGPDPAEAKPEPTAQRNFTDPDSRIMKDGATKSFLQGYNAQAAVDATAQVIVACAITQETNDKRQLLPMLHRVEENVGRKPMQVTADAGYFSEAVVTDSYVQDVDLLVPPDRQKHAATTMAEDPVGVDVSEPAPPPASVADAMRQKLRSPDGYAVYKMRKAVVEPVFGQIKEWRGFRRFLLRGLTKVTAEWQIICLTHNLLKLFRAGGRLQAA